MQFFKFFIAFLLTALTTYLLSISLPPTKQSLPSIGALINPFSGIWQNATSTEGQADLEVQTDQLEGPVKVQFDLRGVPHIFANSLKDAYFVQGFVTARDRLFQLDLTARSAAGRLSEVMGKQTLALDRYHRQMGMTYAAERALAKVVESGFNYELLLAYTAGINYYIADLSPKDYPLEFKLLNYAPEFWTPLKTALVYKAMALTLCAREQDIESSNALAALGKSTFDFLFPDTMPADAPVIPAASPWNFNPIRLPPPDSTAASSRYGQLPFKPDEPSPAFIGSNNWALTGQKTASGHPILCNDPHLQLTLPAIWYEVQLYCPLAKVYGVSLPGIPGIAIGFNKNIAWGLTNVAHDVVDYYTIDWVSDKKRQYLLDGHPKDVAFRIEKTLVKNAEAVIDTIRYTHWGPVMNKEFPSAGKDVAMQWLAHESGPNEFALFKDLNAANNYVDYVRAVSQLYTPAQNIVFASKSGDIALTVQGRFPLKEADQGKFVRNGSKRASNWKGFVPIAHNPHIKNPTSGFVASANQRSTDTSYPYFYNGNFSAYRGRILHRKLSQLRSASLEDMKALQNDTYSLQAEEALPAMLAAVSQRKWPEAWSQYIEQLKDWNYRYDKDLLAPVLFEIWLRDFYRLCWDELEALEDEEHALAFPKLWRTIDLMKQQPDHSFFDIQTTPEKEDAASLLVKAFEESCPTFDHLQKELEPLNWKQYKKDKIRHLARIDAFSSDILDVGGNKTVLNALRHHAGPSWRMIVELGEEVKGYGVYPGGQSGNPGNPLYDNMIERWSEGQYYELEFMDAPSEEPEKVLYAIDFFEK